jgi:hypothetical protein
LCEVFLPALAEILKRHAGQVEAHFWGFRPPQVAALSHARHHGLICRYDRFLRRFSRAGYDIGLAPLPDDLFHRCKTNNKFREYGASRIAGIYSRNEVYGSCVEHDATGLLVENNAESWHDAIQRLIDDAALRTRIQRQARQFVAEHYSQEKFEDLFLAQIEQVAGSREHGAGSTEPTPPLPAGYPLDGSLPGFWHRLGNQAVRSLDTLRRLTPRQAWSALRWFLHDRSLAFWLRWRL